MVVINEKTFACKDIREVKKKIYLFGTREGKYRVDVIDKNTGEINSIYLPIPQHLSGVDGKELF